MCGPPVRPRHEGTAREPTNPRRQPMSVLVMSWVFAHSEATGNNRLVLLAIADRCNDEGEDSWPSMDVLARKTRASKATVKRAIRALTAAGELTVLEVGSGRRTSRYRVTMGRTEGGQNDPPREGGQIDPGVTRDPSGGSPVTPVTSLRPKTPLTPRQRGGPKLRQCEDHKRFRPSCSRCQDATAVARARPTWCGSCDEETRKVLDGDTLLPLRNCPICHPSASTPPEGA